MTVPKVKAYSHTAQRLDQSGALTSAYRRALFSNTFRLVGDIVFDALPHLCSGDKEAFFDEAYCAVQHRFNPMNGTLTRAMKILKSRENLQENEIYVVGDYMRRGLVRDYDQNLYQRKIMPLARRLFGDGTRCLERDVTCGLRLLVEKAKPIGGGSLECRWVTVPSPVERIPPVHIRQILSEGKEISLYAYHKNGKKAECLFHQTPDKYFINKGCWMMAVQVHVASQKEQESAAHPAQAPRLCAADKRAPA